MYNMMAAGEKVLATLRLELFRTLLMQRLSFFDRHTTAQLTSLISVELDAVRSFIFKWVNTPPKGLLHCPRVVTVDIRKRVYACCAANEPAAPDEKGGCAPAQLPRPHRSSLPTRCHPAGSLPASPRFPRVLRVLPPPHRSNVSRDRGLRAFLEAAGSVVVLFVLSWRLAPVCRWVGNRVCVTIPRYYVKQLACCNRTYSRCAVLPGCEACEGGAPVAVTAIARLRRVQRSMVGPLCVAYLLPNPITHAPPPTHSHPHPQCCGACGRHGRRHLPLPHPFIPTPNTLAALRLPHPSPRSVVVLVVGMAAAIYRRHTRDIERRQGTALGRMVAVAQQALDNMRIVRSFAGEALERERFQVRGGTAGAVF